MALFFSDRMGKTDATEATEDDAMLKGPPRRRTVGTAGGWKQIFLCCVTSQEDDVRELDYQHASLTDVPAEIFNHERTLEILRLDCNQISELPRPLFHCHGLKELLLADNEISTLPPALASLIHLEVRVCNNDDDLRLNLTNLIYSIPYAGVGRI